ncbi:hypothetical protein, partial [Thiolapillus sp.]|uniref:hypothetical protein n=1 Tax=Thiolapillus sp. TaxID=2017437 RepID=UPI0025FD1E7B
FGITAEASAVWSFAQNLVLYHNARKGVKLFPLPAYKSCNKLIALFYTYRAIYLLAGCDVAFSTETISAVYPVWFFSFW